MVRTRLGPEQLARTPSPSSRNSGWWSSTERADERGEHQEDQAFTAPMRRDTAAYAAPGTGISGAQAPGGAPRSERRLPEAASSFTEPRFGHDFGAVRVEADGTIGYVIQSLQDRTAIRTPDTILAVGTQARLHAAATRPALQAKLTVGNIDDPREHEANAVADRVMRMRPLRPAAGATTTSLDRKCTGCGDEGANLLRSEALGAGRGVSGEAPAVVHEALRAPGSALDPPTHALMSTRFGADFKGVRIHTDRRAAESAAAIGARAFTVGRDVVFAEGQYAPRGEVGLRLIAHELAHVIQQGGGGELVQRDSSPEDPVEVPVQPADTRGVATSPARPSSDSFFTAYAQIGYNRWQGEEHRHDVWKFVGGAIGKSFDGENTCATRVSYGLNYGGYPIKGFDQKSSFRNWSSTVFEGKAGDDLNYIVGAPQVGDYFAKNYGAADAALTSGDDAEAFQKTLTTGQCAVFAGPHHSGVIKDTDYRDPYVFTDPGVLPVKAWKLAAPSAGKP
jgi:hypothetical protein